MFWLATPSMSARARFAVPMTPMFNFSLGDLPRPHAPCVPIQNPAAENPVFRRKLRRVKVVISKIHLLSSEAIDAHLANQIHRKPVAVGAPASLARRLVRHSAFDDGGSPYCPS
jgi:hypothetical protein